MTLTWTGERFLPCIRGSIELEHLHRYYLALGIASGKMVLDVACGEGYGSEMLSTVARQVIGIDISHDAISHATSKYSNSRIEFKQSGCESLPIKDKSVDLVVSFETIEHHDKHHEMLSEIARVLKLDGLLLISSPDRDEYAKCRTGENEFHVKELSGQEFKDLLKKYFNNVVFYSQRVVNASGISPVENTSPPEFRHIISTESGNIEQRYIHPPLYHIALAGNVDTLPNLGTSIYEIDLSGQSNPQAGTIRIDLLIDKSNTDSVNPIDELSSTYGAILPFDTRIHETAINLPDFVTHTTRIGISPADLPCALALHEISLISSDNRLLWHWDGQSTPFAFCDSAVFIPGSETAPPLIVSLSNQPIAWFGLPDDAIRELHGSMLRLRVAGFTLFDPQILNRLYVFLGNSESISSVDQSLKSSSTEKPLELQEKLDDLVDIARNSLTLRDEIIKKQNQQLKHLRQEIIRAEAQLDLLKDVMLGSSNEERL